MQHAYVSFQPIQPFLAHILLLACSLDLVPAVIVSAILSYQFVILITDEVRIAQFKLDFGALYLNLYL